MAARTPSRGGRLLPRALARPSPWPLTHHPVAALALLSLALSAIAGDDVKAALADVQRLPATTRPLVRYLSLAGVPAEARALALKGISRRVELSRVLAFHCNSLSSVADLEAPALVGPDLLRVNLRDYGWSASTWEKLAEFEPYYHLHDLQPIRTVDAVGVPVGVAAPVPVVVPDEVVLIEDGRGVLHEVKRSEVRAGQPCWRRGPGATLVRVEDAPRAQEKKEEPRREQKTIPHAPWLVAADITALALATGSNVPIVRADWFLYQTAVVEDRGEASYYGFLNLKTRDDIWKLTALDVAAARRLQKEIAALVDQSGVAINNRQVIRFQALAGGYWFTLDAKSSKGQSNVVRILNGDFRHDAEEIYFVLPNELYGYAASAANGELQKSVPPDIAPRDDQSTSRDSRIHPGLSCIRCHVEGLRPIDDWARSVYQGELQLTSPDYDKYKRLKQLYLSDLPGKMEDDIRIFAKAVFRTNGLTVKDNASAYRAVWQAYADTPLGIEQQAFELGTTAEAWKKAIVAYGALGNRDPQIVGRLRRPTIRREHWEEIYPLAQTVVRGLEPADVKVKP